MAVRLASRVKCIAEVRLIIARSPRIAGLGKLLGFARVVRLARFFPLVPR